MSFLFIFLFIRELSTDIGECDSMPMLQHASCYMHLHEYSSYFSITLYSRESSEDENFDAPQDQSSHFQTDLSVVTSS